MWLSKEERKLLSYYYRHINKVDTGQKFEMGELIKVLGKKEQPGTKKTKREVILQTYYTLENVHSCLGQRGLIEWENLSKSTIECANLYDHPDSQKHLENAKLILYIILTLEGYDLGRKYNHWFTMTGLWWKEYKGHWIWSIVAAIVTFIIGWLVGSLTK